MDLQKNTYLTLFNLLNKGLEQRLSFVLVPYNKKFKSILEQFYEIGLILHYLIVSNQFVIFLNIKNNFNYTNSLVRPFNSKNIYSLSYSALTKKNWELSQLFLFNNYLQATTNSKLFKIKGGGFPYIKLK